MTKEEAIKAMEEGQKVTHLYFEKEEWINMSEGVIMTEDGYYVQPNSFWEIRNTNSWDNGWSIWEPENK